MPDQGVKSPQPQDGQLAAFEAYRAAKLRVDAEPTFANAIAAKRAWWLFLNIVDDGATANVVMFPTVNADFGDGS